jgi:pyroglutamyl-peptidase
MPLNTLVTGFGPFASVVSNPSERVLVHLLREPVPGHSLTLLPLPTSFQRAFPLFKECFERGGHNGSPFDVVLMLGVAARSPHWCVERVGRNHRESRIDADGFTPNAGPIVEGAPETLPVRWDVDAIVSDLIAAGLPAAPSDSAGAYLCNELLYSVLHLIQDRPQPRACGFLHIPPDAQTFDNTTSASPLFTFEQEVLAVRTVLESLAKTCISGP